MLNSESYYKVLPELLIIQTIIQVECLLICSHPRWVSCTPQGLENTSVTWSLRLSTCRWSTIHLWSKTCTPTMFQVRKPSGLHCLLFHQIQQEGWISILRCIIIIHRCSGFLPQFKNMCQVNSCACVCMCVCVCARMWLFEFHKVSLVKEIFDLSGINQV